DHGVNPPHIDECCCECGEALDGIICQRCACKSFGKGAHIGYNCPPKVPIISNPEPCNQTMNNEPPQTLPSFDSTCYSDKEISVPCISKPNFVDESSNIFNPPPQPPIYSCEFYGSNAQYGHYCTPQVPFINPELGMSFRSTGGKKMDEMFSGMVWRMSFCGFMVAPTTVGMMKVAKRRCIIGSKVQVVVGIIVRISVVVDASTVATDGGEGDGVYSCDSYFEKAKVLRPTLYDEKVIGLGYTPMFLTHSNEALEIEKFKRFRENKIEFAYDYGNLNASYVNEKINFEDDYFQEIINPDFEKIDSPF
nr:hypothetical protein [Tanacetum cinerariifolium]